MSAGILDAEARALAALQGRSGMTISSLARLCALQQPTMTKTIDRLAARGWVERLVDAKDRRVIRLRMLPAREEVAQRLAAAEHAIEARVAKRLQPGEAAELLRLLRAFGTAAEGDRSYRRRSPIEG